MLTVCVYIRIMIELLEGKPQICRLWFFSQNSFPVFSYPWNTTYKKCDYKVPLARSQFGVSQFLLGKWFWHSAYKEWVYWEPDTNIWEFVSYCWHSVCFPWNILLPSSPHRPKKNRLMFVCQEIKGHSIKLIWHIHACVCDGMCDFVGCVYVYVQLHMCVCLFHVCVFLIKKVKIEILNRTDKSRWTAGTKTYIWKLTTKLSNYWVK